MWPASCSSGVRTSTVAAAPPRMSSAARWGLSSVVVPASDTALEPSSPAPERPAYGSSLGRVLRRPAIAILLAGFALAGCGPDEHNTDVPGFVHSGGTPTGRAILRSIATYRTTTDTARACSLITPHFLKIRFDGGVDNCEQVQREA